jgi:hypothetical protein
MSESLRQSGRTTGAATSRGIVNGKASWPSSGACRVHFARLTEGQHPHTEAQLVRHQVSKTYQGKFGKEVTSVEHRAGWDAISKKLLDMNSTVGAGFAQGGSPMPKTARARIRPEERPRPILFPSFRDMLNDEQAARRLGVSPATLRSWRCREIGPPFIKLVLGSQAPVRYNPDDLDEFMRQGRHVPSVRDSQFWTADFVIDGRRIRKSTKQTKKSVAMEVAMTFYRQAQQKQNPTRKRPALLFEFAEKKSCRSSRKALWTRTPNDTTKRAGVCSRGCRQGIGEWTRSRAARPNCSASRLREPTPTAVFGLSAVCFPWRSTGNSLTANRAFACARRWNAQQYLTRRWKSDSSKRLPSRFGMFF